MRNVIDRRDGRLVFVAGGLALAALACNPPSRAATVVELGTAANFLVLGSSTVTSTGDTVILGDLGLSPGTAITGFPPGLVGGATHLADGPAGQARTDLGIAWTTMKDEPCDVTLTNPELGGAVLVPGVYCFATEAVGLTGQLTLDAQGRDDAVWVFQIASTLTTASGSSVQRINGGSDCNVFWQIGSSATLGTGSGFVGTILASISITATTAASVSGRLLAHSGAVTLDSNLIMLTCRGDTIPDVDAGVPGDVDAGVPVGVDAGPDLPPAVCGNGLLELGEQCDDGNLVDHDGCSPVCTVTT